MPKREDDGREGAISGRLARKATGVSPSGFACTGVFAEDGSEAVEGVGLGAEAEGFGVLQAGAPVGAG